MLTEHFKRKFLNNFKVIDCHMHCGIQHVEQSYESIKPKLEEAGVSVACMYAPVEDIYDRGDSDFSDNDYWKEVRARANDYLLRIAETEPVIPYFFVWNDFRKESLKHGFKGIKWHRHSNEPEYNYNDPRCEEFLEKVFELQLPIVLEEEYSNTLQLIDRINGRTPVIIPHLGGLNGGYKALKDIGVWRNDNVYADTALAYQQDIEDFIKEYSAEKLLFGSDYPFGIPLKEKQKVLALEIPEKQKELILSKNIIRLLKLN